MYTTDELIYRLKNGGVFLTSGNGKKANTMTIGWGQVGMLWGKPVFFALIRTSRYTKQLVEECGCFTVSVPTDELKSGLNYVGKNSGRNQDKWKASGLTPQPAKIVDTAVVMGASHNYECKVLSTMPIPQDIIPKDVISRWYPNDDFHTIYIGEIVAEY